MGKKKDIKHKVEPASQAGSLAHNPFGSLSNLDVPAGQPAQSPAKEDEPVASRRFPDKIVVRMETKGRAGKTVTRISGLPAEELSVLLSAMKKALGCGAVVDSGDLLLLGSLVERAASHLEALGASRVVRGN